MVTRRPSSSPNAAFLLPLQPSEDLAAVVGDEPRPRTEVVKALWSYIKRHRLQDKQNKKIINADEKLERVFGKKQVNMFEMTGILGAHLTVPEAARDAGESLEAVAPARGGGLRLVGGTAAASVPHSSAPATAEGQPSVGGRLANLSREHREALEWFAARAGREIPWPEPLNGTHVVNRAKGIHKPAGFRHALSIRQSLAGPYEDAVEHSAGEGWILKYAQEGDNPNYFTNEALKANLADGIPVAVLLQVRPKPDPRYRVLGLGRVVNWRDGVFEIHEWGASTQARDDLGVEVPSSEFDATDGTDAREKMLRAIAIRRGQPAFRSALIEAYDGKCAITGCDVVAALEAAHILPYRGDHTNHVQNGILMRADLHTLFDLRLLNVDPDTYEVRLSKALAKSQYAKLEGARMRLPASKQVWPSVEALRARQSGGE